MTDDVEEVEAGQGGDSEDSSPRERTVPLTALQAERTNRQKLERELAELRGTVNTLKETQSKPKEHTRADLQAAVDAGRISQVDADRAWEEQRDRRLKAEVKSEVATETRAEAREKRVLSEIDRYTAWKPEIMEDGSEARSLVAEAYSYHVNDLGKPEDIQTQLDALITVYGPASKLQKPKPKDPETHQDVGSDGGGEKPKAKTPKLPSHVKAHYEKQIDAGRYKGWDDPVLQKEMEYGRARWG